MKMTLDEQDVMDAILVYMAIKGIATGDKFTFIMNGKRFKGVTLDNAIPNKTYDIDQIVKYAREER